MLWRKDMVSSGPARSDVRSAAAVYVAVVLVSAATLIIEIALTRLFSLTQGYHFAFLSISLALLGFGFSGSVLGLRGSPGRSPIGILFRRADAGKRGERRTGNGARLFLVSCALLFAASALGSYLGANHLQFDSYRIAWEPIQSAYFLVYYALLSLPFFFAGLLVGYLLASAAHPVRRIYAANMVGSAFGSMVAIVALPFLGVAGEIALAGALGVVAAGLLTAGSGGGIRLPMLASVALSLLVVFGYDWLEPRLSPYRALSQSLRYPGARVVFGGWSALSRVDVVESAGIRSFPGISLAYAGDLPPQMSLMLDGESTGALTRADATSEPLLRSLPQAFAHHVRPAVAVLLLEPHGNIDGLIAQRFGVGSLTVTESDGLVARLISEQYADYLGRAYSQPGARLVPENPRSYLARGEQRFDLIHLSLTDPFQPVTVGTSSLAENYLVTSEAFRAYYDRLTPDGLFVVTRWLQAPPSEELRAWILAVEAVAARGGDPALQMLAYRSWSTVTILVSHSPLRQGEIELLREWLDERLLDPIYFPGVAAEETNHYNVLTPAPHHDLFVQALSPEGRRAIYEAYRYDVTPPSDDRPFFHHFFRWSHTAEVVQLLGRTWQPFAGAGYLLLLGLLLLVTVVGATFILGPLALIHPLRGSAGPRSWPLLYFSLLGVGFLLIEIPFVQRVVLLLGHPTLALAATLLALLLFSGIGSLASRRLPPTLACGAVALLAATYPYLMTVASSSLLGLDPAWRFAGIVALLAPLGFAMGIPFPSALAILREVRSDLVPWAWGVNGFASVVSSVLGAVIMLTAGFSIALWLGSAAYVAAALVGTRIAASSVLRAG